MSKRSYDGPAIDGSWQYFDERPVTPGSDAGGETVYATEAEPQGEERTEGVPVPDGDETPPEASGQTTLDDWGCSA